MTCLEREYVMTSLFLPSTRGAWRALLATMLVVLVVSCAGAIPRAAPPQTSRAPAPPPATDTQTVLREATVQPRSAARLTPQLAGGPSAELERAIESLGRGFNGNVGIAVRDVEQGWTVSWNGDRYMPQQSVSKTWVALTVLDAVDRGQLSLSRSIHFGPEDLVVFHQPWASRIGSSGFDASLSETLTQSLTRSDNLANDKLLWTVGGPEAVRNFFVRNNLQGLRFGPGERLLQSGTAGLDWNQRYAGQAFYSARANLSSSTRNSAMDRYLADPVDGATADGMVEALARLARGELLSPQSTALMIGTIRSSHTGPQRLRGGVPAGWLFGHKTGTGQDLNGIVAGYNDVGIVTAPDGTNYAVAVLIGSTRVPIPERQRLMQAVMGQIVNHHLRRRYELLTGASR